MGNADPNPPAPPAVGRRELLAGGLGGVAGLAAGAVLGRTLLARPAVAAKTPEKGVRTSYAQFGDDLVADSLFKGLGIGEPTYLDIGAADPVFGNNTYHAYLEGSRGVLVEPDVAHTERLKSVRPDDKLLVAGIGIDDATEADFYVMSSPGLNTFDKGQAERLDRDTDHKIVRVVKLPLLNINRVIAEHLGGRAPDFLSIDIEGLEFAVLKTLDLSRYRPKLIVADTLVTGTTRHHPETTPYLVGHNYEVRGMTFSNTFYVDKAILRG
ncbi:MAG TPA: FkbM family methyltransferase [Gemmata sp.]|nr:FkbM family methyltransferase [Gemmata sp.]